MDFIQSIRSAKMPPIRQKKHRKRQTRSKTKARTAKRNRVGQKTFRKEARTTEAVNITLSRAKRQLQVKAMEDASLKMTFDEKKLELGLNVERWVRCEYLMVFVHAQFAGWKLVREVYIAINGSSKAAIGLRVPAKDYTLYAARLH